MARLCSDAAKGTYLDAWLQPHGLAKPDSPSEARNLGFLGQLPALKH